MNEAKEQAGLSRGQDAKAASYFTADKQINSYREEDMKALQELYSQPAPSVRQGELLSQRLTQLDQKRDANTWRAHQHKEEHLPEYIEQARQEAEAAGHTINVAQPKE